MYFGIRNSDILIRNSNFVYGRGISVYGSMISLYGNETLYMKIITPYTINYNSMYVYVILYTENPTHPYFDIFSISI